MQRECLLHLAVIRGINLPSVDLLSKIDAYVKVKVSCADAQQQLHDHAQHCCSTHSAHKDVVKG